MNEGNTYIYKYPHPAVATDCVVFGFNGKELEILLIKRGIEPFKGMWAFPGGFMRMDETAEECALRELAEETKLSIQSLKQLGAFTGVHRDPRERVVTIAFYALVRPSEVIGGDDASHAEWFPLDDAPPLAFDHDYILRKAQQQLRKDIHFEPVGFELLNTAFTMSELQRLYEAILGVRFDRRNFEKKMLQTGILEMFDETTKELPPDLFDDIVKVPDFDTNESDETVISSYKLSECREITPRMACEPASPYYGPNKELRHMDIDALFSSIAAEEEPAPAEKEPAPKKKPGRKGRRFCFNKDEYDRFKRGNNFKLEF